MAADPQEKFIHRDLSWLSFNERVLEEAADTSNPFLERLRFLAIFVNNLDEFYMVRVASLKRLLDAGYNTRDRFGYYPQDLYQEIRLRAAVLIKKLYEIYQGKIHKESEKHKIFFKSAEELNKEQKRFVRHFFETILFPIITPMAVDQGHPFPVLPTKTIAFAINVVRDDKPHLAIIPVPKNVPRALKLPSERNEHNFILIDEVTHQTVAAGMIRLA